MSGLKNCGIFRPAVPNFLAPGTGFMEDNFSTDSVGRGGKTGGRGQLVMRAKLCSLACCSLPAVLSTDRYQSTAGRLGTPDLQNGILRSRKKEGTPTFWDSMDGTGE